MDLSIKDAVSLYQSQLAIVNALWTFFGTVTLAVVGFTIGSAKATHSRAEVTMIIGGYATFAVFGNLTALRSAYADLLQFSELIDNRVLLYGKDLPALHLRVPSVQLVTSFYLGMVAVVSLAIVAYSVFRARERTERSVV